MTGYIEEWIERMRDAREPGPAALIVVWRKGRSAGTFELANQTDLSELAERIAATCEYFVPPKCELRALDAAERTVGSLRVGATSQRNTSKSKDDDLGRSAIVEARRLTAALSASLQAENTALREEGRDLRLLLTLLELWRAERTGKSGS